MLDSPLQKARVWESSGPESVLAQRHIHSPTHLAGIVYAAATRADVWNGANPESVKCVLGKIARALTHSTLLYVSPVAFEQATPLHMNESPP
jgi:hypothetical protein